MNAKQKAPMRKTNPVGAFVLAVLDPLEGPLGKYDFRKDTSHLLLSELGRRGNILYYTTPSDLFWRDRLFIRCRCITPLPDEPFFSLTPLEELDAESFRLILMRKDPPVDQGYVAATQLLSLVSDRVPVLNAPRALRDWNEKLSILPFRRWIPPTLVTSDPAEMERFLRKNGGEAVIKSLWGFAGKDVSKLSLGDQSRHETIAGLTHEGTRPAMIQAYLKEVKEGEKRIFLIDGKPLGAISKIPAQGSFLANPDLGGHMAPAKLTPRDKKLCADLAPFLKKHGIFFAGIDVIGGRLTEINITSPGLVWEWNEMDNKRHEVEIVDALERTLSRRR